MGNVQKCYPHNYTPVRVSIHDATVGNADVSQTVMSPSRRRDVAKCVRQGLRPLPDAATVQLSTRPTAHLSNCAPVHPSTCPPVQLSTCPTVHHSTCPTVQLCTCPIVHPSTCPPVQLPTRSTAHLSTRSTVHPSTPPTVHLSNRPPFHLSNCPPVHPSNCPAKVRTVCKPLSTLPFSALFFTSGVSDRLRPTASLAPPPPPLVSPQ